MVEKNIGKISVVVFLTIVSITGFMIKLPKVFSDYDKLLHLSFYFIAAMVLNYLFAKKNFLFHIIIAWLLFCAGIFIESIQELSNSFVLKKIHGNFDPEDVIFNAMGIMLYSILWVIWCIFLFVKSQINYLVNKHL